MTSFEHPKAIRHFQSICDSCQDLVTRYHTPSDLRLYCDGYLQALRNCSSFEPRDQEKIEKLKLDPTLRWQLAEIIELNNDKIKFKNL